MGVFFDLQDANLLGWLTWPNQPAEVQDKEDVLHLLRGFVEDDGESVIAADPRWRHEIVQSARRTVELLNSNESGAALNQAIRFLKESFGAFPLYALVVGRAADFEEMSSFVRHYAGATPNCLFLCPKRSYQLNEWYSSLDVISPFPAIGAAVDAAAHWPGLAFWTASGVTSFAPLETAKNLLERIDSGYGFPPSLRSFGRRSLWSLTPPPFPEEVRQALRLVDDSVEEIGRRQPRPPRLLQLSDLHFGTKEARKRQAYLMRSVEEFVEKESIARIIVTGDLFNNPSEKAADDFFSFRDRLHDVTGTEPIVIPGNHDEKHIGNLPASFKEAAALMWKDIEIDDQLRIAFFCFDSSKDANLARGRVTPDQRMKRATRFKAFAKDRPEIKQYLKVALIHHHPFSFHIPPRGIWQLLEKLGLGEEKFLRMEDGDEFVEWCAHWGIPLIMHGHKHVPNHAQGSVTIDNRVMRVDAIGCGSSTGINGYPLSFNILTWSPTDAHWTSSFYSEPGDGRGFTRQRLKMASVDVTSTPADREADQE